MLSLSRIHNVERKIKYLTIERTARHILPVKTQVHGVHDRFSGCERDRVRVRTLRLCRSLYTSAVYSYFQITWSRLTSLD